MTAMNESRVKFFIGISWWVDRQRRPYLPNEGLAAKLAEAGDRLERDTLA
jgi:hypothetical protein